MVLKPDTKKTYWRWWSTDLVQQGQKCFFVPLMRKNRRLVDFLRSCRNSYHLPIIDERMTISNRRSKLGEVLHGLEWSDRPQSKTVTISFHPQYCCTASNYSYSIGCMSFSNPNFHMDEFLISCTQVMYISWFVHPNMGRFGKSQFKQDMNWWLNLSWI